MDFSLTNEQVSEIQLLNAKLVSVKVLAKEALSEGNNYLFDKLIIEVSKAQIEYEKWFDRMQDHFNIVTRVDQHWNVDFQKKVLQLLS